MDRAFQRIRSLMLRGTFYSVPPTRDMDERIEQNKYPSGSIPHRTGGIEIAPQL